MADTKGGGQAAATPGWSVTGQQEGTRLNDQGQYVQGVLVSFRLASGQQGSIFVPESGYNPENVKQLINARAQKMASIAGLAG